MFRSSTLFLLIFSAAGLCPALSAQEKIGKARGKIKITWSELNTKNSAHGARKRGVALARWCAIENTATAACFPAIGSWAERSLG